jgi:NAD(P)-dependent dehydrogenase (short-subunit alcohol dehydrogenase family)
MEAFQETMREFLNTQRATMLAYLGQTGHSVSSGEPSPQHPASPEKTSRWNDGRDLVTAPSQSHANGLAQSSNGHSHVEKPARSEQAPPEPAPRPSRQKPTIEDVVALQSHDTITSRLVEIVRDRTGYPAEMLKLDLDLEADLGIDSIKRVEILGTLRESVSGLDTADTGLMDDLARARTLGSIVDRVALALKTGCPTAAVEPMPVSLSDESLSAPESIVRRMTLEVVDAPLDAQRQGLMPGGVVVVTDDGRGVASSLGDLLQSRGHGVAIIERDRVDFASPSAVDSALAEVRATRPIAGIVHALPLRSADATGLDPAFWSERVRTEVNGLFLLARATASDLDRAAKSGGACLVAATAMGGSLAARADSIPPTFFPGQGGVAGLVKTLAREWPDVRTRVVDLDPSESSEQLATRLAVEALSDDGWPEVGYRNGRRIRLQTIVSLLDRSTPALRIAPGEPILITGGARGITATVAAELARRWQPTLLLVGSSPLPPDEEDSSTARLVTASELKAALHSRMTRSGRTFGASELEQAYRTLLGERQIRTTLKALREAGSQVDYTRADVRDPEALGLALNSWRRRFGDPVGLIHGAGVIHDKLLRDKTPESFDRVFGTKLDGALNLARLLRPEPLRFAALFSSIAGRFGNEGQSDYAAANDALNKLAVWLDRRLPGRVVAVNWGPWSGVGMVSDLEGHLGRRGLGMIPPEVGSKAMVDEILFGRKGDVEVVVAANLGSLDQPLPMPPGDSP